MATQTLDISTEEMLSAVQRCGGIRAAARELGIGESTIRMRIKRSVHDILVKDGSDHQIEFTFGSTLPPKPICFAPDPDRTRYFILTAAQDDSAVHMDFWKCLNVYAEWLENCEIMVSGFAYSKKLFTDHETRSSNIAFHPEVAGFVIHDQVHIGDGLAFCAEANTQPTAARPLSGFTTYTKARWGIFPHVKVALESVPTMKNDRSKQIMTTGAVTLPNYIRMKAGVKAMHHHVCGAVLVELAPDGTFFCRHLLATDFEDGSFYDLDCHITRDGVTEGHRVEALTYGDIHEDKLDPICAKATWGYDPVTKKTVARDLPFTPLCDFLRPNYAFYHDLYDQQRRNHHSIDDPYFRYRMHIRGYDSVEDEIDGSVAFLCATHRDDTLSMVVESNHDQALLKWLRTADYRKDPANALFFLRSQLWVYEQLETNPNPGVLQHVLRDKGIPDDIVFVDEDTPFQICGDIECGMHGHNGANGGKGSALTFAKAGARSNTGHTHSPTILDGAYIAGVSGKLDMGYNKGLSSWAHAHIVTYANGKRAILTMMGGRFFA